MRFTLGLAGLCALVSGLAHAQSTTQSIQGLVTDASGAVISGAKVTITNFATGVSRSVETNQTGNYSFQLVPVGNYDVRVELQAFKTETARGLRLETAAQLRLTTGSIVPDAARMGEIQSLRTPMRIIQLGLKFYF